MARGKKKTSKSSRKVSSSSTTSHNHQPTRFGDWDPRLTNCQHYIKFHRDSAEERPPCQDVQLSSHSAIYDAIHEEHMMNFHIDSEHPGFCTEGGADVGYDSQEDAEYDLDHSDFEHDHQHNEEGQEVFSMDLPTIPFISHTEKRHKILLKLLGIHDDDDVAKVFTTISTITDPMTQPIESDSQVISLDLVSQLVISLCFDKNSVIADFKLAQKLFVIIDRSLKLLNCHDEVKMRSLNNSDIKVDWKPRMHEWTPRGLNDQDLRLLYMINSVCIYTIYKLYLFNEPDLCLNPFLGYFIKLWKIFTNVVLLGLEVDRRTEPSPEDTPNVIKQVIRGSSAVRYVLASILNDDLENRYHDFHHLNIFNFLSPYGRRNGSGALYADVRWYVGAMLALGSELNEVVETLVDLEPNDRYDEDVKYMFSYEYEDFHHQSLFPEDYEDGEPKEDTIIYEDQDGILHKVVHQRCTCQFFDGDEEFEDDDGSQDGESMEGDEDGDFNEIPTAIRSEQQIDFDELGRDWRDVPREGNIFFNPQFTIHDDQCLSWPELSKVFDDMVQAPISEDISKRVVMTIAKAVKFDFEQNINNSVTNNQQEIPDSVVTPDKVYQKWSHEWTFEAMLALNPVASYAMLDEMFMAHGYRRVLIWFITHMALSFTLMNYVFELVNGLRGESRISKTYPFSRQGPLAISEVEKSMLLHEFLNNCLIFLSKTHESYKMKGNLEAQNVSEFEKCIKIVKLICLMVNKLIEKESIDLDEYKVELTSILINWIGLIEEARELFFRINNNEDPSTLDALEAEAMSSSMTTADPLASTPPTTASLSTSQPPMPLRHKKFNPELKVALGNVIKKMDNGTLLFRPFFELINYDAGPDAKEENGHANVGEGIQALVDTPKAPPAPVYVKGEMKPLRKDEFYEHERVEQAMEE